MFINTQVINQIAQGQYPKIQAVVQQCRDLSYDLLQKIKAALVAFRASLIEQERKVRAELQSIKERFSSWAASHSIISCFVSENFFSFGDIGLLNTKNQNLKSQIETYSGYLKTVQDQINAKTTFEFLGIKDLQSLVFSFLETKDRIEISKSDCGREVIESYRQFQWDILDAIINEFEEKIILKGNGDFKEELKHILALRKFFKKYSFPAQLDARAARQCILFHIGQIFKFFSKDNDSRTIDIEIGKLILSTGANVSKINVVDLEKDKELALALVKSENWKISSDRSEVYVQNNTTKFKINSFLNDREFLLEFVNKCPADSLIFADSLQLVDSKFRKDEEILLIGIKNRTRYFLYASPEMQGDVIFVLLAVKRNGRVLEFVKEAFKKDREIVLEAVRNTGSAFEFADPSLKGDRDFNLLAVRANGEAIHHCKHKDSEIVKEALKTHGLALRYADQDLKKDLQLILESVRRDKRNLEHRFCCIFHCIDDELKKDDDFYLEVVKAHIWNENGEVKVNNRREMDVYRYENYPKAFLNIKGDPQFCIDIIKRNDFVVQYFPQAGRLAFRNNAKSHEYLSEEFQKDPQTLFTLINHAFLNNQGLSQVEEFIFKPLHEIRKSFVTNDPGKVKAGGY